MKERKETLERKISRRKQAENMYGKYMNKKTDHLVLTN
jgi:hypothetical protein